MPIHVIIGGQRGDEGKGRFVDLVAQDYTLIARGNGGANAGHTIVPDGLSKIALHQVPSGIAYPGKMNVIGNGVYLDPVRLHNEITEIAAAGIRVTPENLAISDIAHLVLPHHVALDNLRESTGNAQGSTKSGISYVAADKYLREGIRLDSITRPKELTERVLEGLRLVNPQLSPTSQLDDPAMIKAAREYTAAATRLVPFMTDTVGLINDSLEAGELILGEGAQAFWLDINHGMYPAVTSSSTTASGLLDGLGVAPRHLTKVTLVAKAVKSHVGGGPLVTEITDESLAAEIRGKMGATDSEFGATTKRPRRIGYPDLVELRKAIQVNGADELVLSKLDHIPRYGASLQVAVNYLMPDGSERSTAPSSAAALANCTPIYKTMENWHEDISALRSYNDLPQAACDFVSLYEQELALPITVLGVGPDRNQVIKR